MTTNFRTKTVYIVREGLQGGYMPDSLTFCATRHDAESYMIDRKHSAIDDGYKVYGSAKQGYYSVQDSDASEHSLGQSIVLDSVNADMYITNIPAQVKTMDDLIQYLNDHYSA